MDPHRRHAQRLFPVDIERLAARRDDPDVPTVVQQRIDLLRDLIEHVLAVVDHQQHLLAPDPAPDLLLDRASGFRREVDRVGERFSDVIVAGDPGEIDEDCAVFEPNASRAATSMARRVFPQPPAPASPSGATRATLEPGRSRPHVRRSSIVAKGVRSAPSPVSAAAGTRSASRLLRPGTGARPHRCCGGDARRDRRVRHRCRRELQLWCRSPAPVRHGPPTSPGRRD